MKNTDQIQSSALTSVIPVNHILANPLVSSPPLKDVVEEFMTDKTPPTREAYERQLEGFVRAFGQLPLNRVTTAQIRQFVFNPNLGPRAQKQRLSLVRAVLDWGHDRRYLPPYRPTAADQLKVVVPKQIPPVLMPSVFKRLLEGTRVVELLLWTVLSAFAGLRSRELEGLSWDSVRPGIGIGIAPGTAGGYRRAIPMQSALNVWLRPFYGSQGKVFKSHHLPLRVRLQARSLGIVLRPSALRASYGAHRLAQTYDQVLVASELGYRSSCTTHLACLRITLQDAAEFFALKPEDVGISNWPEMVAQFLGSQHDEQC